MAVSPLEVKMKFEDNLNYFESLIDEWLLQNPKISQHPIHVPVPNEFCDFSAERICLKYIHAGWSSAELISDKDGKFIKLTR